MSRKGLFALVGTHANNVRTMRHSDSVQTLRSFGRRLKHYAIYRNAPRWHSTAQAKYLIEHKNDPYWINRGIA